MKLIIPKDFPSGLILPILCRVCRVVWGRPDLWKGGDKPETAGNAGHNPDPAWESQSLPIGNGSLGANIMVGRS